ncbi:unnamed protein product [Mycena citricolor]|uniref:Uncharacterized protein n=1 Tax=Mycena citricolor TaxID=2018698 RepID=A0AAD2H909_9AGAR|nr:unnamed protein product [Mycena citricolor]
MVPILGPTGPAPGSAVRGHMPFASCTACISSEITSSNRTSYSTGAAASEEGYRGGFTQVQAEDLPLGNALTKQGGASQAQHHYVKFIRRSSSDRVRSHRTVSHIIRAK